MDKNYGLITVKFLKTQGQFVKSLFRKKKQKRKTKKKGFKGHLYKYF